MDVVAKRTGNPGLKGRLLDKSVEAYILALETINRLSIKYRVETFCILLCTAWELLCKAELIEDAGDRRAIYYTTKPDERPRTFSLKDCPRRIFPDDNEPIRRNVERISELRDECVHLVFGEIPNDVMALFQASVLGYYQRLGEWFNVSLSDRVPVGMMTLVYDLSPEQVDLSSAVLRRRVGKDAAQYLMEFQTQLRQDMKELGDAPEFSLRVQYRLGLSKTTAGADIQLMSGAEGTPVRLMEVAKDAGRTHPHPQKEVLAELNRLLPPGAKVNQYDIQAVLRVHSVKKRPEFHYCGSVPGSPQQYSPEFIHWLDQQYQRDPQFFNKARRNLRQ